jgi:hypothetical protein
MLAITLSSIMHINVHMQPDTKSERKIKVWVGNIIPWSSRLFWVERFALSMGSK